MNAAGWLRDRWTGFFVAAFGPRFDIICPGLPWANLVAMFFLYGAS